MPLSQEDKKYTYADYLTYPEAERWEIIDGVPYMQVAPTPIHQEILMELSKQPSSIKKDRFVKFNLYEKAGVKEYWIVEPDQKLVSVFLLQKNERFSRPEMYTDEDGINVSIFPDLIIDLSTVFASK